MPAPASDKLLYSSAQVGVASLICGPLGVAVLLKRNFRAIGAQSRSAMPLVSAFVVTFVGFFVLADSPRNFGTVLGVALGLGSWRYALLILELLVYVDGPQQEKGVAWPSWYSE